MGKTKPTFGKRKIKSNLRTFWKKQKGEIQNSSTNVNNLTNISNDDQNNESQSNYGMQIEVDNNCKNLNIGRRIVDFSFVFNQLLKISQHEKHLGCEFFQLKVVDEFCSGFFSLITIKCEKCNEIFRLKTVECKTKINLEAVSGITSIGSGYSGLQQLFSILDIPVMGNNLYEKNQKQIGYALKHLADISMKEALEEEKAIAVANGEVDAQGLPLLTVVADGCWSKRSYGTNYNALSGCASIIGYKTNKIIYMGVKNKYCVICSRSRSKGENQPHDCNINYEGPSTGMESTILVEGFIDSTTKLGVKFNNLIADGDSSVYKNICQNVNYPVCKIECKNHLYRNFNTKLRNLTKNAKMDLKFRKLIKLNLPRLITGIHKAVTYRKSSDIIFVDKVTKLKSDILNTPYHVFGLHDNCDIYFCKKKGENTISMNELNNNVFNELKSAVDRMAFNSRSLLLNMNSNICEQFNAIIAKWNGGKRINFSLKKSYENRCYGALVQHNSKKVLSKLQEYLFNCTANNRIIKLEENLIIKSKKHLSNDKIKRIKYFCGPDKYYGVDCSKPDVEKDDLLILKQQFLNNNVYNYYENRINIEEKTIEQSSCSDWHSIRKCFLTSSNFGYVIRRRIKKFGTLIKNIMYSNLDNINSTKYGRKNEEVARTQLELELNIKIKKCGLFIHREKDICFLASTPDGLIDDDGIVEIKCPSSISEQNPLESIKGVEVGDNTVLGYLKIIDGEIQLKKNHIYYYQIQGQLEITNRNYCLFCTWSSKNYKTLTLKIYRDRNFWKKNMEVKLKNFYLNRMLPELVDSRYSRKMDIRDEEV